MLKGFRGILSFAPEDCGHRERESSIPNISIPMTLLHPILTDPSFYRAGKSRGNGFLPFLFLFLFLLLFLVHEVLFIVVSCLFSPSYFYAS